MPGMSRHSVVRVRGLVLLSVIVLLAACGADDSGESDTSTTPETSSVTSSPTTSPGEPESPDRVTTTSIPPVVGEVPDELLEPILDDAAERAGVAAQELRILRAQAIEWSDGSLGCPQPGEFYTQAIVSGYWVVVEGTDETYDYRVDGQGNFRLCENEIRPPSQGGSATPTTTGSDS